MAKKNKEVSVVGVAGLGEEILAKSIVTLSIAAKKMESWGLNRHGLSILLQDYCHRHHRLPQEEIIRILSALPELKKQYVTKSLVLIKK